MSEPVYGPSPLRGAYPAFVLGEELRDALLSWLGVSSEVFLGDDRSGLASHFRARDTVSMRTNLLGGVVPTPELSEEARKARREQRR